MFRKRKYQNSFPFPLVNRFENLIFLVLLTKVLSKEKVNIQKRRKKYQKFQHLGRGPQFLDEAKNFICFHSFSGERGYKSGD